MTVSSESNKVTFDGNGVTTVFPFTFPGVAADDLSVTITDSDGVETILSSSAYTVSLTAAVPPNPTGTGGSITYNPLGVPLAAGNMLTILRTIPLTQTTSLANQGTSYQSVIEQALDVTTMKIQQLDELLGRQITVAVSDDTPAALPPAAQRAGLLMGFDDDGNPIAVDTITPGTTVSSAMIPVVTAASVAVARDELGLGDIAVEDIGAGLEDDGAGAVRTINVPTNDAIGQSVTAAFHTDERHATAAITYTNPAASTLFDGFSYTVFALGGTVTFALDAGDAFSGMSNGVSLFIPQGTATVISTDGVLTWYIRPIQLPTFGSMSNLRIDASVAGNNLTVAIKERVGNNPSFISPIVMSYRSGTLGQGDTVYITLASALSIVAANGASFGASNSVPFKLWLVAFRDGTTIRLGLINTLSGLNIYPLGQVPVADSTLISAGATAAHTFYTNGAGVSAKTYTILGYMSWEDGLATAGTWASAPTKVQLFGQNVPLPGAIIQNPGNITGAVATGTTVMVMDDSPPTSSEGDQYMSQAITPTSKANLLDIETQALLANTADGRLIMALLQDATVNSLSATTSAFDDASGTYRRGQVQLKHSMLAGTTSSTTFKVRAGAVGAGTTTFNGAASARLFGGVANSYIRIMERMT